MTDVEQVVCKFREGFNCAQAIFSTYGPKFGIDQNAALKVASAFGAGMRWPKGICGAVSGALMVISLKHGRIIASDIDSKEKTYNYANEYMENFQSKNGSIICSELIGCDLCTDEGRLFAKENNLFEKLCVRFVKDAAEILEEML